MSRYNYTEDELDLLRVLKMQEQQLKELEADTEEDKNNLELLERDAKILATRLGVDIQHAVDNDTPAQKEKLRSDDIPEWSSLVNKSKEEVDYQPFIEDFLSQEEINYSLEEIKQIKKEFKKRTKLNKTDLAFLIIATTLQTLRWVIINKVLGDIGETIDGSKRLESDDKTIKDKVAERNNKFQDKVWEKRKDSPNPHGESSKGYRSWQQILWSSVPFDTSVNSRAFGENMGGAHHRSRTLGHDPILGWLFGTANIITDTITLSNWKSYRISRKNPQYPSKNATPFFSERTTLPIIFYESYDSIKEDKLRLPAAVYAEFVHLESDKLTKLGLPVPILEAFNEDLAGKLYRKEYDSLCLLRDIKTVGAQAVVSVLINMLITLIHGLFYNAQMDGERNLYEVRTRKVLLYSNSLASVGNIAYSAATQDWGKLDVGGIIVTITRLFSDIRFITKMKHEFIQKELDKSLMEELSIIDNYFE